VEKVLFHELRPLLNYFPIKIGETELTFESKTGINDRYRLFHKNKQWMSLDLGDFNQIKDQYIEINLASGKVVTTGLGLGLKETILSAKPNVKEVIVFEKNADIIKMFNLFAQNSNFDTSKITIIHDDAENASDVECDWLLLDHYEPSQQVFWEIVDDVRRISRSCKAKKLFFWPFVLLYNHYCLLKGLDVKEKISYNIFVDAIKIKKMPKNISEKILMKMPVVYGS